MALRRLAALSALLLLLAVDAAASSVELAERVADAARTAAAAAVAAPDRFEVVSSRFAGADPLPGDAVALVPLEVDGPNLSGIVRVTFRMEIDGLSHGLARASVRGRVFGPALVAKKTLRYGERISPLDVTVVESDLTRSRSHPLRAPGELAGRAPARTLSAGRLLTDELLRPATAVHRGETVAMAVRRAGLLVTLRANVLKDGAPGDRVPVRNLASGARMVGEVQADGTLVLIEHARSFR